ncbi:MAG: YebC/PmpR family DNA-binding transcriptional regulator [Hydrogenophilaceae bacterium]|jgi:YebC/PmpR family DNA-binding regulatory protein|nr:YebC/PmpR family DNA-binding transcriptional regulator [Hydrogenophilaceae bacterium]
MAGHSKFANIMHRKGAQDKKRASLFTKIAREIQAAVKLGGSDPAANPRLYRAIASARAVSMPKDNIQRAVDRGAGGGGENLEEIRYEGFGPGGVGVIVECLTDNRNRTAGDVRAAFAKNGGNLGETNSVSFMWDRVGEVRYPAAVASEDAMLEAAIEAGADDCMLEDDAHVVTCAMNALGEVSAALAAKFGDAESAKFVWRPQALSPVSGEAAQSLAKLVSTLDDLDDVQNVYTNADVSDEDLAKIEA